MKIDINPDGIWYHGSNCVFTELRENSTVTPWRGLAEAFSHQPSRLNYDDNGVISHNGKENGYLYIIDEPVTVDVDIYQHPRTTMDPNAEFLTRRPLKVKMICELPLTDIITDIIFVRHAQSVYGEDDRNRPLTEDGLKDRQIVLDVLKDRKIDAFLCSPYKRSIDTIKPASDYFGSEIICDERLRERKTGSFEADLLEKRWKDFSFAEDGGESLGEVQKRNMEAFTEILKTYKGKTIVVGTHGTALSTILRYYKHDFGLNDFLRIVSWMPYIFEMRFDGEKFIELNELAYVDKNL